MSKDQWMNLSRRERQIMDTLYMLGEATALEIHGNLNEEVGKDSVRKLIRVLEQKGHLKHRREGQSYIYIPTVDKQEIERHAMRHMLRTFFQNSTPKAVSALLAASDDDLSKEDIEELNTMIRKAEKRGE
ncbi:MAG: BlaI/MecI/CopY family transcriptional regulator [bacterium]|nr:BlaI/MecI/CopY family transcriptional regulator [bacterium]